VVYIKSPEITLPPINGNNTVITAVDVVISISIMSLELIPFDEINLVLSIAPKPGPITYGKVIVLFKVYVHGDNVISYS
jgi:hypothetical protein